MNLHEYQAKQLFRELGIPVSRGIAVDTPEQAAQACLDLGGERWVIKTQVHAGGRGKAGGIKLVNTPDDAQQFANQWLGKRLVTQQTDAQGQPVNKILVEICTDFEQELYLGAVIDRASQQVVFMASTEGGVDIEKVAAEQPDKILKVAIDPLVGAQPFQGRTLAYQLGLVGEQVRQFANLFTKLAEVFVRYDMDLLEVNPLVIKTDGSLVCLDAKLSIDSNALYRQPVMRNLHDPSQEDSREQHAAQYELNYVALEGDIGCMVNGAGLAMGTMDMISLYGGAPANFLDVGGGATKERVSEAFKIILSDQQVKAVLVNIFGGIVRCDMIAEGIIGAVKEVGVKVPVVVRLEGNNAAVGLEVLAKSGLNIIAAHDLSQAAELAVKATKEQA